MSFADDLIDQARAHQEIFIAGVQAADENSPSARKLARLIEQCEHALRELNHRPTPHLPWCREKLRTAIEDATSMSRCHATDDGSCGWASCPQTRDGEPTRSARSCPLGCESELVAARFPGFAVEQIQAGLMMQVLP